MRRLLLILAGLLAVLAVWQRELLAYGWAQARGQWRVIREARPVAVVLADPAFPDSLKARVRLVQEIRRYAVDSLGIDSSGNYTTLFDQRGEEILWNVTGCRSFAMEAKTWHFPLLGTFSYRGFFNLDQRDREAERLRAEGYEVRVYPVQGWSTLGWLQDPILSNMLRRSEGQLANLIIHELTHGTLYVKDNVRYNENLATFVGDQGARRFLAHRYGPGSEPYRRYVRQQADRERYSAHVLRGYHRLDSLYRSFPPALSLGEKQARKTALIGRIVADLDTVSLAYPRYRERWQQTSPDNNYFMSFRRYRQDQNTFEKELEAQFDGDFPRYLSYLKEKYPSLGNWYELGANAR